MHNRCGLTLTWSNIGPKPLVVSPHRIVPSPMRDTSKSLPPSFTVAAGLPGRSNKVQCRSEAVWQTFGPKDAFY